VIILDNKKLSEFNIIAAKGHSNPSSADFSEDTIAIPDKQGVYYVKSQNGIKQFRFPLIAIGDNNTDAQKTMRTFNDFFHDAYMQKRLVKMSFEYEAQKYYDVRLSKAVDASRIFGIGEFDLIVTSHDGYSNNVSINTDVVWGSEEITFESEYQLDYTFIKGEQITAPITLETTVDGYAIRPIFLISGSGDNVTFQANGKSFSLDNFSVSDWVLDGKKRTVTLNNANGYDKKTSRWIDLLPGQNDIAISGTNMNFTLTVEYRDKYL